VPYEKGHRYPGNAYYCAPAKPGARVTIIEVGGEPFSLEKTYRIAASELVVHGGSAYGHAAEPGAIDSAISIGCGDRDAVANYLREKLGGVVPDIYRAPQGRITILQPS